MTWVHVPEGIWLFSAIFSILIFCSLATALCRRSSWYSSHENLVDEIATRIMAWWWLAIIFTIALICGLYASLLLFAILSLLALREYITLTPARPADHRALFWSFFIILPCQYYLISIGWYGLYSIFIPVYAFILIPLRMIIAGDCTKFLERSAKIQWGLMLCAFFLSHVPALLSLHLPNFEGRNFELVFYLVFITEMSDVFQFAAGKTFGAHKIAPYISPNKTWEGFAGGLFGSMLLGYLLSGATPFSTLESIMAAVIIMVFGVCGGLVMSAIKRDQGIKDYGTMLPGHGGVLDRIDSLCFAAPVFFHITRYFFSH